jgi:hypothetical protein
MNGNNNGHDQQVYNIGSLNHHANPGELARSNTLRSSGSDNSSQNGLATIYAVGNASGHVNGTQTLMTTPSMGLRKSGGSKSGGTASTIRKIFGSSSQRKVSVKKSKLIDSITIQSFFCIIDNTCK